MSTKYTSEDNVFKPSYYGADSDYVFKTTFRQIDNRGGDIEPKLIIIFDGGDVYGYEEDLKNCI